MQGLRGSRAVVERHWALLPPEGIPDSVLPDWEGCAARILAAPAMGAAFAEYRLDLAQGGGTRGALPDGIEAFGYVLDGRLQLELDGAPHMLAPGGFAFLPPGASFAVRADRPSSLLWLRKRHEPFGAARPRAITGDERAMPGEAYMGTEGLILKTLLPVDAAWDMAINIFTFPPGFSLPVTETHVMEHGLYMLEGQGVYYLGDRWVEVRAGDFVWMGPYCPQSFYATGDRPARYIYYKNVHRDVVL